LLGRVWLPGSVVLSRMTPQEIAEVRPRLLDFTAEMLGGLPRKDQWAAGELYVARQYSGTPGKVANCQIGVSVHLVNEHASCAADWRLFCPR
jgi:SRSO17 transposase